MAHAGIEPVNQPLAPWRLCLRRRTIDGCLR